MNILKPKQSISVETEEIFGQKRCNTCVLPRSLAMVDFDSNNTCEFCRDKNSLAKLNTYTSAKRADELVERIRQMGDGRPYDALVGLSGGRDSTYMAYLLHHKHKLRLLGTNYRTPFTPKTTDANVRRITQSLDIPLTEITISRDFHIKVARSFFLRWHKDPRPEYASLCCAVCKLLNSHVFQIARQHKIQSIIYAGNPFENVQFLTQATSSIVHRHNFGSQFRRMIKIFGSGLLIVFQCSPNLVPISVKASLLYINPHTPYLRLRYPSIHRIEFFHYAPWVESDCVRTIQNHMGWQSGPDTLDTWKADCDFADLKNYMFYKMYGATYNDALYSNLIRAGQITRDQAISRIRAGAGLSLEHINRVMETLDLPRDMIDRKILHKVREI